MRQEVHEQYRDNSEHWWFRARRLIFDRLLERCATLPVAARILDVGPGSGINLPVLGPRGSVTVIDCDLESARACRRDGANTAAVADAHVLPFADHSFDLTCALDVIEHLDDDARALHELFRVTAPGGYLLLSVPAFQMLWGQQDIVSEHRRRYRLSQLRDRIRTSGFEIEKLSYFNSILFAPILAVRLLSRPFLRWTAKRASSDFEIGPAWIDGLMYRLFASEAAWLPRRNLPIGVSLVALARRPA